MDLKKYILSHHETWDSRWCFVKVFQGHPGHEYCKEIPFKDFKEPRNVVLKLISGPKTKKFEVLKNIFQEFS